MTVSYLDYAIENGYIHNWLVVGPQAILVAELDRYTGADYKLQIARHYYERERGAGILETPAETQPVAVGDFNGKWEYVRCKDDHFVDLSTFHHICHYLRAWAYAQVVSPVEQPVTFVLTTNGPADVWLNGEHIHRQEHFHHQLPHSVEFTATLKAGVNEILVRFEEVAARECPYSMALRIVGATEAAVRLPTVVEPVERRQTLEEVFYAAMLRKDVYNREDEIVLHWPEDMTVSACIALRIETPDEHIRMECQRQIEAGVQVSLAQAAELPEGEYWAVLIPTPIEHYQYNMRLKRKIRFSVVTHRFSQAYYGDYEQRRQEALVDASRREGDIFPEIARMALGEWQAIDRDVILKRIESINHRGDCSDFYLTGLLGMLCRFGQDPHFPPELYQPLEDCILHFKYWHDEPGSDSMCYTTENHSILFHTCEVLAGQLYPGRVFTNNGETGQQHCEKGEQRALDWLRDRATLGFKEWDSNCYFEEDVLALSHLASLAENSDVMEMASVVLDKLFFILAVNSYQGVFGSTHGRTYTPFIKSGYNEATSGISRMLWGLGTFNSRVLGTVSLACSDYELPPSLATIALDRPKEMWSRERHAGSLENFQNSGSLGPEVNKVTYKTPDYMLCSAQDYHPGEKGYQQHVWQATFGPEAVVFVTHPTCASEDGSHRPSFWHGNETLPRVAQWKNVLIAIHNLPENDWMGFTHAFFPTFAFDEYDFQDGWAFAHKGHGYLALTAACGLTLMTSGDNAYRELRSYGQHNIWVCHLGRQHTEGSYERFKRKMLAMPLEFGDLLVKLKSLPGDSLEFGWTGPLMLNGLVQPVTGFKHIENPYCEADLPAMQMEIRFQDTLLRLKFEKA